MTDTTDTQKSDANLDSLIAMKAQYERLMQRDGEAILSNTFKKFFKDNPEVSQLRWPQFTPFFNDGDPCTFGIGELEFKLADDGSSAPVPETDDDDDDDSEYDPDLDDDDDNWLSCWDSRRIVSEKTMNAVNELANKINSVDDCLNIVFGDHVQVYVSPEKITVEEYDHD